MGAVEEAVFKDFKRWGKEKGNSNKEVGDFMEEMYAMKIGKGNIFDKIKAMASPLINSDSAALENLASCINSNSSMTTRTKRSTRSNNNHNNKVNMCLARYSPRATTTN